MADALFFAAPDEWRECLTKHHADREEQWVGFYKKGSTKPSITYQESVDQALCFGWIDGLMRSIDEDSYRLRFTPRRPGSNWSEKNVQRVGELIEQGLMHPAGLKAFEARKAASPGTLSYEQRDQAKLDPAHEDLLRANRVAWEYFQAQPPGYRKTVVFWIMSAKQDATRLRRLAVLIDHSERQRPIPALARPRP